MRSERRSILALAQEHRLAAETSSTSEDGNSKCGTCMGYVLAGLSARCWPKRCWGKEDIFRSGTQQSRARGREPRGWYQQ